MNTSNVDTDITNIETPSTSIHDSNTIIPHEGPTSKSHPEEDKSLNTSENLSNKDSNVNVGEASLKDASTVPLTPPPSSPLLTLTIQATFVPLNSPIFEGILQQPITSLFSSQPIENTLNIKEEERVKFVDLDFNYEEEKVKDHNIMHGKQYNILNLKLNMIL